MIVDHRPFQGVPRDPRACSLINVRCRIRFGRCTPWCAYAGVVSIHRGTVTNNADPALLGRLQVIVPSVSGNALSWAMPVSAAPTPGPTPIGASVWVAFEDDDSDRPVVLGLAPSVVVITPVELAAELGHDDGGRPGRRVRQFLRERYPDHPSNQRWLLTPEQANEVRVHFAT